MLGRWIGQEDQTDGSGRRGANRVGSEERCRTGQVRRGQVGHRASEALTVERGFVYNDWFDRQHEGHALAVASAAMR